MKQTIADIEKLSEILSRRAENNVAAAEREPVHVVYGGANLYMRQTPRKLGKIALQTLEKYAPQAESFSEIFGLETETAQIVYQKTVEKLRNEPIEDFRIDFEDGYGFRPDKEEDKDAVRASEELAEAFAEQTVTPFCGFRVKAFAPETNRRALRTLDLFLTNFLERTGGKLPSGFVVTLPKVERTVEVEVLADILRDFEQKFGLSEGVLKLEVLIETPSAVFDENGLLNIKNIIKAADNRCTAAHFGAYDYTSNLGIAANYQDLHHPACDFVRSLMKIALANTSVRLSDSVTTQMPTVLYKDVNLSDKELSANRKAIGDGLKKHFENILHSLKNGFYQSWDLHPNQLIARYAAVYAFFVENFEVSAKRLRGFVEKATQANLTGNTFDDAASANGLLIFFARAESCGAFSAAEIEKAVNIPIKHIRQKNFQSFAA